MTWEFFCRISIHPASGRLDVEFSDNAGSGSSSYSPDPDVAKLSQEDWDQIQVDQLGANEVVMIGRAQTVTLLQLTFPPELRQKARESQLPNRRIPMLYQFQLVTDP
jgi:hypothetical protein